MVVIGIAGLAGAWEVEQEIVTTGDFYVYRADHAIMAPDDSIVSTVWFVTPPPMCSVTAGVR